MPFSRDITMKRKNDQRKICINTNYLVYLHLETNNK